MKKIIINNYYEMLRLPEVKNYILTQEDSDKLNKYFAENYNYIGYNYKTKGLTVEQASAKWNPEGRIVDWGIINSILICLFSNKYSFEFV